MYVIANTQAVELCLNGQLLNKVSTPRDGYVFAFPDVKWEPGTLTAVGLNDGKEVARHELATAGPARRIKLTPIVGPAGLLADGADVALIDVEVVDDQGPPLPNGRRARRFRGHRAGDLARRLQQRQNRLDQ